MVYFEMAKTVIKSLIHGPSTIRYPAEPAKQYPISRGHVTIDPAKCISCGMCMRKCPADAICVMRDEKLWEIDLFKCHVCNCCVEVCPVHCLSMDAEYRPAFSEHEGVKTVKITYVKPEKKAVKKPAEEKSEE
ncbi:4Fe-4S dicluster domain-containing protein [Methanofollis aquaemaris]|uniref:4Fe-4S dicluster domain-containing protein n=1 Tax=Methanofollis aquaemaris TaxID=126734 RepID=A0A8A3S146_9EURY|nr:4Fe-4S binding protein [Methanofollis aquaemaris]QSZ66032.1 4Fe-4S dicluster domain-containing protein [Methanofollis aquaemaris]